MSDALKYAKEVLEAHEKKPEASLPGLLLLARAVVRQDEEIQQLKSMAQIICECDSKKINAQIDEINELKAALKKESAGLQEGKVDHEKI